MPLVRQDDGRLPRRGYFPADDAGQINLTDPRGHRIWTCGRYRDPASDSGMWVDLATVPDSISLYRDGLEPFHLVTVPTWLVIQCEVCRVGNHAAGWSHIAWAAIEGAADETVRASRQDNTPVTRQLRTVAGLLR